MTAGRRLTACAASDHPDPAVAVGEIIGELQNSLAGSPQFALVLVDLRIGSLLSTIASAVHGLLGPDLALAVAGPHVAGADHLGPARAAVVVWALCGVDVRILGDGEADPSPVRSSLTMTPTTDHRSESVVTVRFGIDPDGPRPLFISGDGRRQRPSQAGLVFPAASATVVRSHGEYDLGPVMEVTDARGRTLRRLDHIPARAVLIDRLETTDGFVDGPSPEFPPLRAIVRGAAERDRVIDVVAVDPDDGAVELAAGIAVGDRVQLVAYDRAAATRSIVDRLIDRRTSGDRAVLVDVDLASADVDHVGPLPTAVVGEMAMGGPTSLRAWAGVSALSVQVSEED